jgi:hypothetical protein
MNKPLLVVLPYHAGDIDLARKLVEWIAELGSCRPHSLLLCADAAAPRDKVLELMELARPHFLKVQTMLVTVPVPTEGKPVWPPNVMFLNAARQVRECYKFDFLWLEPDAIPMYAGWLDDIAEEYGESPFKYMGSLIEQKGQEGLPPKYLNGVAVYPNDAISVFEKIVPVKDHSKAFDIGSAPAVIHRAGNSLLIHHFWGNKELPPIFVDTKAPDSPKNHVTLDFVRPAAAIFHRSKDGKLIDLLRARRGAVIPPKENETVVLSEVLEPKTEPEKTSPQPPELTHAPQPTTQNRRQTNQRAAANA